MPTLTAHTATAVNPVGVSLNAGQAFPDGPTAYPDLLYPDDTVITNAITLTAHSRDTKTSPAHSRDTKTGSVHTPTVLTLT